MTDFLHGSIKDKHTLELLSFQIFAVEADSHYNYLFELSTSCRIANEFLSMQ